MSYKALYRTYRPTTFEDVAGQAHIVKTLKNALTTGKIAHAYLFCGPRGTGKTTMAKLFAKALNCEKGIGCQCNACSNCLSINDGSHPDVIEIDAASNNGVEDVRDIIERVKYSPIKGKYKVYIIDEVHMMSPNAFNALLKTLEEPPANVIFILATTEPHKVLPTILSRCQRYDFSKVDDNSIKGRMEKILGNENITYEDKALDMIISLADGGMRDALSLLDQAIAYSGTHLAAKDIEDIFGLISISEIVNLIKQISIGNIDYVITKTNALVEHGTDIRHLTQDMLDVCKDVVLFNKLGSENYLTKLSKQEAQELCGNISSSTALEMIDILMKAQADFKEVNNIKTLFEVTLMKLTVSNNKAQDLVEHNVNKIYQEQLVVKKNEEKVIPESQLVVEEKNEPIIEEPVLPIEEPLDQVEEQLVENEIAEEEPIDETPFEEAVATPIEQEVEEPKVEKTPQVTTEVKLEEPKFKQDDILQADELPPFLREGEKIQEEEKNLVIPTMVRSGDVNALADSDIINLMVLGNKEARKSISEKWPNLQNYILNSKYNQYAGLLRGGVPFIFTKEILILTYEVERESRKANIKDNQSYLQDLVEKIYGRRVRVYALYRPKAVELYKKFQTMYEVGKLPKANEIKIKFDF